MTSKQFRAPLAAALFTAAASIALMASPALAATPPKLTHDVNNALADAQKALTANDFPAAQAAVDKAKAVPNRTPVDDYVIDQVWFVVALKMNDMAGATSAVEAQADSPALPAEDKPTVLRNAVILADTQKQFDKAAAYAKQLQATNPTDPKTIAAIRQSFLLAKDYPDATVMVQKEIDDANAAGQKPSRELLNDMIDIEVAQKDEAGAEKTLETMVADYNDPKDWTQMIDVAISSKGIRDVEVIWLGRLLFAVGATPSAQDLTLFGSTADHLTFFGDAEVASQHGGTGFANDSARADADKKTITAQIAAGQKQGGQYNAKLAEAVYSYGMYPEAEAVAKLAMSKGGATDSSEAPMVLGQALAAQGKYDEAIAAFGQVTGGGPATARITRLWVDYCNIKKNPPAAAPTTASAAPAPAR